MKKIETSQSKTDGEGENDKESALERLGTGMDTARMWVTKAWRIGVLMGKGAYLLTERRRLFGKLGEEVYYKILKGELQNSELEPLVHQLDRLTKKIEIEEMLIRGQRFGKTERHQRTQPAGVEN